MKTSSISFALVIIIFLRSNLVAQDTKVVSDLRLSIEIEITKKFFKKWQAGFGSSMWFEKNASRIGKVNLDIGLQYELFKFLNLSAGYRWYENRTKTNSFEIKHRYNADLGLEKRIGRFRIDYRIRYQNVDDDFFRQDELNPSKNILRNRLQARYNIQNSKLTPFSYLEHYGIVHSQDPYSLKIKWVIGSRYSLGKSGRITVFYRIDRELENTHPYTYYNLGLGYEYDF